MELSRGVRRGGRGWTSPHPIRLSSLRQGQRAYYERTARAYDDAHIEGPEHEHGRALAHVVVYLEGLEARSVLDTGCGTCRALRYLRQHLPHLELRGNDPSDALLQVAVEQRIPRSWLDTCGSERLPRE